jgi:predicted PhzF superfamily epimerase YddE/YHI9
MSFAGHPTIGTAIYLSTLQQNAETSALFKNIQKIKTITGVVPFESSAPTTKGPREGQGQAQHSLGTAQVSIPHNVHIHSHRLPHLDLSANPHEENTVPLVSIVKGMTFNLVPMKDLAALGRVSQGLLPIDQVFDGKWLDKGSGWDVGYTGTFYYVDLGWEDIAFEDGDRDSGEGRRRRVLRTRSIGTREDPGTGSASCALCCYLALIQNEAGEGERRVEFHLTQGVEMGRRCDIYVSVLRTPDGRGIEEVKMSGEAVKVMEGVLGVGED